LYRKFSPKNVEPTERGRQQFFEWQSYGAYPDNPDPYFLSLDEGRKWFHVQQTTIKDSYLTWEWWGWYCYWVDWKGERWVLRHLMAWHPEPPSWLFKEDEELTEDERKYLLE
jgi:hypothetical protein